MEMQIDRGWRVLSSGKIVECRVDGERQIARDYGRLYCTVYRHKESDMDG
jgi:hypothetical protein